MKILLADDEPLARSRLISQLADIDETLQIVAQVGDGQSAIDACVEYAPDVVLLDISMPGLNGIQTALALQDLAQPPAVIFITAYDAYALAAFDAHAIDYLLKPVHLERLARAIKKARLLNQAQQDVLNQHWPNAALTVSYRGGIKRIPVEHVIYLRAAQKYVEVGHQDGIALLDESLKSIEMRMPGQFIRIHRNALIGPNRIQTLSKDAQGHPILSLQGTDVQLEISRRHLPQVRRLLST